jgi:hypothetical protein
MGAGLVRQLPFVAMRAFGERQGMQVVMGAPLVLAGFRMAPFWIRHIDSS